MTEEIKWSYMRESDLYVLKSVDLGEFGERQEESVALTRSQALRFAEMVCFCESLRSFDNRPSSKEGPL